MRAASFLFPFWSGLTQGIFNYEVACARRGDRFSHGSTCSLASLFLARYSQLHNTTKDMSIN